MSQFFSPPPRWAWSSPPPPPWYWYWSPPPPRSPPPPYLSPPPGSFSVGSIVKIVVVMCSVLIPAAFIYLVYFICFRRRSMPSSIPAPATSNVTVSRELPRERRGGLDISTVQMFPVLLNSDVRQLKEAQGQIECAICMSEFEDDEILRMLPGCCHVFHLDCIGTWLALRATCPVCRINLKEIDIQDACGF